MRTIKLFHYILAIVIILLTGNWEKLTAQTKDELFSASVIQDVANNFSGGMKTGAAQLGMINLDFKINTKNLNLWKNGTLRIQAQNTYGQKPTENMVGDMQVFSNIENGLYTYLYQFWYKQKIGNFSVLLGKHDLNEIFFASEYGAAYINSSFGIMPLVSLNVPVSIFPMTTLGMVTEYDFNQSFSLKSAAYNGDPGKLTESNYGTDLNIHSENGLFFVSELHYNTKIKELPVVYKMGGFHHSGNFSSPIDPAMKRKGSSGVYFIADQTLIKKDAKSGKKMGVLLQVGYCPNETNLNDFYMASGVNISGVLTEEGSDNLGIAVAYASLNNEILNMNNETYSTCETAIELTYNYQLTEHLCIQPDVQYILNPGMKRKYNNALIGMVRINWNYN